MRYDAGRPLLIQSDSTMLLQADHERSEEAAIALARFAELVKTPGFIHTYRMTPLSLWNAASSGMKADEIISLLEHYGTYGVPAQVRQFVSHCVERYGLVRLEPDGKRLLLVSDDRELLGRLADYKSLQAYLIGRDADSGALEIDPAYRGMIKQDLIKLGFPVHDLAGYHYGERLPVRLRETTTAGQPLKLREYQQRGVQLFCGSEEKGQGGSGVVVLPCGAGKTVVGIAALAQLQCAALILTTNVASVRQWRRELIDKTDLSESMIGEYSGDRKEVRPVTIATYQVLTHRSRKHETFVHMSLFHERDWGLIIYDEVHLLPAPVFRATADIQATRRLGLTATLVREDGRAEDVFSLVGPKLFEAGWKDLEQKGWVARVRCTEIRVPLSESLRDAYTRAEVRHKQRIAGENPGKLDVLQQLLERHSGESTLVIGQYLDQLEQIAEQLEAPMISGDMPHDQRDRLYADFNRGNIRTLVVSKVANFAIDLPDARVAIQVSGSFGSRQEEAQRLGRILRPKRQGGHDAHFYSLVSADTREQEFSMHRQLFLLEQGYRYEISRADESGTRAEREMNGVRGGSRNEAGRIAGRTV